MPPILQRLAHPAAQPAHRRLGRSSCEHASRANVAQRCGRSSGWFGEGAAIPALGRADRRCGGDQQAALFGQACFRPRRAEKTLRHRCFLLCTRTSRSSSKTPIATDAWRLAPMVRSSMPRGQRVRRRRRRAMGWRRSGHRSGPSEARRRACPTAALFSCPAFTGLGAPIGTPRARCDCRPHARHHRAQRRSAAIETLPTKARSLGAMERMPKLACASCASMAAPRQQACSNSRSDLLPRWCDRARPEDGRRSAPPPRRSAVGSGKAATRLRALVVTARFSAARRRRRAAKRLAPRRGAGKGLGLT